MAVPRAFIRITVRWPLDILPVACMWPVHITCTIPFIHKQSYWLAGGCVSDVTARSMPYTRKKEEEIGGNFERASERQNRNSMYLYHNWAKLCENLPILEMTKNQSRAVRIP